MFRGLQRQVVINSKASRVKKYAQSRLDVGVLMLVALTTACGGGGGGGGVTNNPVPSLTSLSPSSVTAGSGAFTLTVNGSNLTSSSSVRWNGSARTTTFVNSGQVTAAITAADIATAGTASVTVINPSPGGGGSNTLTFAINQPVPALTSLSPSSATAGGPQFTLTVNGSNFMSTSVVNWNGSARATSFVNSGQVTATILSTDIATEGSAQVTVVNPAPGGGTSNALTFTITSAQPTITSLSPSATLAGLSAFTLTVNGSSFDNTSIVLWNGSARTTTFVNSNQLTAAILASDITSAGSFQVSIRTTGFSDSNSMNFTVTAASSLLITTTMLPLTGNGKDFHFVLASSGGTGSVSWLVTSGSLPAGLSLDPPTGLISGTVTDVTGSTFTVQATDSASPPNISAKSLTITLASLGRNDNITACGGTDIATPIPNGTLRASISPYGDVDTYTFTLTQPATNLSIDTFAQDLDIGNNLLVRSDFLDTVLELLDINCNVVALNDDLVLGVHTDSEIQIGPTPFPTSPPSNSADKAAPTTLPPGTYFIRVRDYRGDGRPDMPYDLTVSGIQ